jgi:hypothetical protein
MGASTPVFAQSADFKCAPAGTLVENADGSGVTWLGPVGNGCRIQFKSSNGSTSQALWFGPTATYREDIGQAWAAQVNPSALWPLSVGKLVKGHYEGEGMTRGYNSKWNYTFNVEKSEKITTKAGTFDTFVVVAQIEQLPPSNYRATVRQWYAPVPGVSVKYEYIDNEGKATSRSSGEVVSIRKP